MESSPEMAKPPQKDGMKEKLAHRDEYTYSVEHRLAAMHIEAAPASGGE
jgi:hypothetical protein